MNIVKIVDRLPSFLKRHKIVRLLLLFFPKSRIQLIQYNGSASLFADLSDPEARSALFTKSFEQEFFSIAEPFLAKGGAFFDLGANFGFCSFGILARLYDANIEYHLFEANNYLCGLLRRSRNLYPDCNMFINNYCVSDSNGISRLYIDKANFGKSFISDRGMQEVRNIVLDEYIEKKSIKKINFLKIDIEGWEPAALGGMRHSLASGIVEAVYIELFSASLARSGFSTSECLANMAQAGYRIFYVKSIDFDSGAADKQKAFMLNINGFRLRVSELNNFPDNLATDILAIRKDCGILQ